MWERWTGEEQRGLEFGEPLEDGIVPRMGLRPQHPRSSALRPWQQSSLPWPPCPQLWTGCNRLPQERMVGQMAGAVPGGHGVGTQ